MNSLDFSLEAEKKYQCPTTGLMKLWKWTQNTGICLKPLRAKHCLKNWKEGIQVFSLWILSLPILLNYFLVTSGCQSFFFFFFFFYWISCKALLVSFEYPCLFTMGMVKCGLRLPHCSENLVGTGAVSPPRKFKILMKPRGAGAEIWHTWKSTMHVSKSVDTALQCAPVNFRTKGDFRHVWPFYDQNS